MGRKKIDLTGQRFGNWTVLGECEERSKSGRILWECSCDCGTQSNVPGVRLKSGSSRSCGCLGESKHLVGKRFGRLVVTKKLKKRYKRNVVWECLCDCGEDTDVTTHNLTSDHAKSCGCLGESKHLVGKRFGRLVVTKKLKKRYKRNVVWECLCDCGNVCEVATGVLKSGNTKSCGCLLKIHGVDHPNYKPHLTDEERLSRRYQLGGENSQTWSKQILERDNYTCQICNQHGGNLNAHHLNAWNAFPEQRFDLDNGVTLCTDCHKDFHSQYGYGDNTREQFDEYAASKTLVLN